MGLDEKKKEEIAITQECIRTIMFYGIVKQWSPDRVYEACAGIGISERMVDETLNEGLE